MILIFYENIFLVFRWALCKLLCLNSSFWSKMAIFLLLSILAAILCCHSNHKSQNNIRSKHFHHSSIKTCRIKCWAATFIFSLYGGPENPVNARLHKKNIVPSSSCSCGSYESTYHFFFKCPNYSQIRNRYLPNNLNDLNTNDLLHGKSNLSETENETLFSKVQDFILNSGRFA